MMLLRKGHDNGQGSEGEGDLEARFELQVGRRPCVFVGPVGLEPTTYGVLVGPSSTSLKVALNCMFVGAWLWLFLPAQPPGVLFGVLLAVLRCRG